MKSLAKQFKDTELREITPLMIEQFRSSRLNAGNKKSTTNRFVTLLKRVLNVAKEEGFLEQNPATKIKPFPESDTVKERILTEEEETRLKKVCAPHIKSILTVALNSGMRPGEIYNLKWKQVDLRRRLITVEKTKSGKVRHIPINQVLFQEFLMLKERANTNHYVYLNQKTGKPLQSIKTGFKAACRRASLTDVRLYDARHTFASRLLQRGADIETIRELLGHSDIRMTMRYTCSNEAVKRDAVERLSPKTGLSCDTVVTSPKAPQPGKPLSSMFSVN